MEALLALLLGVALLLLAALAAARASSAERERRIREELEALRRSARPASSTSFSDPSLEALSRLDEPAPPAPTAGPEAPPPPAPAAPEPLPDAYRAAGAVEEIASRLRALESALGQVSAAADFAPREAEPLPVLPSVLAPDDDALALLEAEQALEELSDEASRLGDRFRSGDEAAARLSETSRSSQTLLALVEARAGTASPLAAELSGIADRLNLLALNLALLATSAGGAGEPFHASAAELRILFEETRRLARELAAHGQGSADAARRAAEASAAIAQGVGEQQLRDRRGAERLQRVRAVAARLGESLGRARATAASREEQLRRWEAASGGVLRTLSAERQARAEETRATAALLARLETAATVASAARRACDEATESLRPRRG